MLDLKENIDYTYIEVNGTPGLKILSDDYEGVIYTYSNVSVSEASEENDPDDLPAVLSFNFDVADPNGYTEEEFETIEFRDKIGNILLSILQNSLEKNVESESVNSKEPALL